MGYLAYRGLLGNAIPDLIICMDRQGTYLDIKPTDAFSTLVTAEDIGRNIADLLPRDVARQVKPASVSWPKR